MLLRMTHLPDDSPDDWEYQESPKVQKSLRKILESRVGMYPQAAETSGGKSEPPAGGGVVGRAAALVLREGEQAGASE